MPHHHHTSSQSSNLPGDEFRKLRRQQDRENLAAHFEHQGGLSPSIRTTNPRPEYKLSQEERARASSTRNATRAALGPSFGFDDASYERASHHKDGYEHSHGWADNSHYGDKIPQKYLDEFDQRWHEDTEDHDADQYMTDHMTNAPWRRPAQLEEVPHSMRFINSHKSTSSRYAGTTQQSTSSRHASATQLDLSSPALSTGSGQSLRSKFSFDEEEKAKRSFELFRRR